MNIIDDLKENNNFDSIIKNLVLQLDEESCSNLMKTSIDNLYIHHFNFGLNIRNTILREERITSRIPHYNPIFIDCYSSGIIYLIQRHLENKKLYSQWVLLDCNWMEFQSIPIRLFENYSIRARFFYGLKSLQILVEGIEIKNEVFLFLLSYLQDHLSSKVIGSWHYPMSEITPNSILNDKYVEGDYEFLTKNEFDDLKILYLRFNSDTLLSINDLFEIATADLYSSIINSSQYTLDKLVSISERLILHSCKLPHFTCPEELFIKENNGWGKHVRYEDIQFV